jgi:hypothetical protein
MTEEQKTITTLKSDLINSRIAFLKHKLEEGSIISPMHLKEALLVIYELQLKITISENHFSEYVDKYLSKFSTMRIGLRNIADSRRTKTIEEARVTARKTIEEGKWS